jgi:GNAT superfamily N-acetyltransferase
MPNEITTQPGSQSTSPGASANALTPLPGSVSISRVWWRPPLEVIREFTESAVAGRNIRMFAVDGNQVVGWCDIFVGEKPGFEHAGSLGMGVLKSYRRQGFGYRSVRAAIDLAWDDGLRRVELEVFLKSCGNLPLHEVRLRT